MWGLLTWSLGCAAHHDVSYGPRAPAPVHVERWTFQGQPARKIVSPNYIIYTTITDPEIVASLGQMMEGALSQYRRMAPAAAMSGKPMECYVFATRPQWAHFTENRTGPDAAVYLQINRGGYTVHDWFVAYFLGDLATYSVVSHEGWHQFCARHMRNRLPPFLEEGLACMFEDIHWNGALPRWNMSVNSGRLNGLRNALEGGYLLPLEKLISMHAGQIVETDSDRIEGFYAQNWAFARFLWEAQHRSYQPAIKEMLDDAVHGNLFGADVISPQKEIWNPEAAKPLLEHYLGTDLETLNAAYQRYVRDLCARGTQTSLDS